MQLKRVITFGTETILTLPICQTRMLLLWPHTVAIVRNSDCLHLATGNMKTNFVPTKTIVKVTFSIELLLAIMKLRYIPLGVFAITSACVFLTGATLHIVNRNLFFFFLSDYLAVFTVP